MLTYHAFAQAVASYLEAEWPAAALAVSQRADARRAAVRATLEAFMRGATTPHAAGEVAFAVSELVVH